MRATNFRFRYFFFFSFFIERFCRVHYFQSYDVTQYTRIGPFNTNFVVDGGGGDGGGG